MVLNMPALYRVLYKMVHHTCDRALSIPRVISMLGHGYTRVVNMTRLHRVLCKLYFKDSRYFECLEIWIGQVSEYTKVSKYARVLNILGFWIWRVSKYVRITHGPGQNAPLSIFDGVLNMPLVLKRQGYRSLKVVCKLYSKDSRYSEYASHCVKSVQIRSFFWSVFSCIWTKYGDLRSESPYSVPIQENTDQKKLRIWRLFI